jgi:hypothetical protein
MHTFFAFECIEKSGIPLLMVIVTMNTTDMEMVGADLQRANAGDVKK